MADGYTTFLQEDFSGGLNLRDAPSEVGKNESPDCMNVTLDQRGGVVKRLGLTKLNGVQLGASSIQYMFYWQTGQKLIVQQGTSLYVTSGTSFGAAVKVFSTSAMVAMADFQGKLVVVHPVDGVWTSPDAAVFTQTAGGTNNMEQIRGNCMAVWQNKVWVGGDPNNRSRVWASNAGDPTKWTYTTDWIDMREKDDALVTAIGAGNGMDVSGRPGLLVFKTESTYRINSSNATTGFTFTTLSRDYGAAGPLAVASANGLIAAISVKGIIVTDGVRDPIVASDRVNRLFRPDQIQNSLASKMCAGFINDRIVFSIPRIEGSTPTTNTTTLEYNPQQGWIVPHTFSASCFATWANNTQILYSASTTQGYVYQTFVGGSDDGAAIDARYQSRWLILNRAADARIIKLVVSGRGTYSLYIKTDYDTGTGTLYPVAIGGTGGQWGTGVWGTMLWGSNSVEDFQWFYPGQICHAVSFNVVESSTTSTTLPKLLQDGTASEVGNFALYGIEFDVVTLGRATT